MHLTALIPLHGPNPHAWAHLREQGGDWGYIPYGLLLEHSGNSGALYDGLRGGVDPVIIPWTPRVATAPPRFGLASSPSRQ